MLRVQHLVQMLEETNRFQVLAATEAVWNPLARVARVVEVEHRSDRIDAQTIEVILVDPEQRVRNQKVLHFVAAVVEDERAPVGMRAFARIGVLVKVRAIEECEAMRIARKMRGRPIEYHSDAFLMGESDEENDIFSHAEATGHRKISNGLIATRLVGGLLNMG